MRQGDKYEIEWVDCVAYHGWYSVEDVESMISDYKVATTGYFVKATKLFTVIAQSINMQSGEYGNLKYIPRDSIIKVKEL